MGTGGGLYQGQVNATQAGESLTFAVGPFTSATVQVSKKSGSGILSVGHLVDSLCAVPYMVQRRVTFRSVRLGQGTDLPGRLIPPGTAPPR